MMKVKTRETKVDFLAQPPNVRRMMLAQDIKAYMAAEKIEAKIGLYIMVKGDKLYDDPTETEVCHAIYQDAQTCECCARGAFLMARIGYQHPVEEACEEDPILPDWYDQDRYPGSVGTALATKAAMLEDFSLAQIGMIEACFEQDYDVNSLGLEYDRKAAERYGRELGGDTGTRLEAICDNMLANNGNFLVPAEYYKEEVEEQYDDEEPEDDYYYVE